MFGASELHAKHLAEINNYFEVLLAEITGNVSKLLENTPRRVSFQDGCFIGVALDEINRALRL